MKYLTTLNRLGLFATITCITSWTASALPTLEERALCSSYKQIYSGDRTVSGHGSETIIVSDLGRLGLGRVYLPGPGLVNAGEAAAACKIACSVGINGKNCLSTVVYHKCSTEDGTHDDPFIPCGADTSTGGFWYCDFYTQKLTASDFSTSGGNQGGNIRSSTGFVQTC